MPKIDDEDLGPKNEDEIKKFADYYQHWKKFAEETYDNKQLKHPQAWQLQKQVAEQLMTGKFTTLNDAYDAAVIASVPNQVN
jgi:hypothetical protein